MAETEESSTRSARFYRLHRDEQLAKKKQEYDTNPEVITRRAERERMRAEREAEKLLKQIEKENKLQEKIKQAIATSQKKIKMASVEDCPAS